VSTVDWSAVTGLRTGGFEGFIPIHCLRAERAASIPDAPGLYVVHFRRPVRSVRFVYPSPAGHYEGRDPTVSIEELKQHWVAGSPVVYIGKARATLRGRVSCYLRFGKGEPVPHQGGRYIWQIGSSDDLLVCWKVIRGIDPRAVERNLIEDFRRTFGKRPFANLQA
jgi:hypothetical protein